MILSNNGIKIIDAQPNEFSNYHVNETHVTYIESEEIELDSLEIEREVKVCFAYSIQLTRPLVHSLRCETSNFVNWAFSIYFS